MWQRIQTIFLSLIAIFMISMIFLPLWIGISGENAITLTAMKLSIGEKEIFFPYSIVATLAFAAATLAVIEITKFKNRLTQIKLGALNSLVMAASMVVPFLFVRELETEYQGAFATGLFMPALSLIFNSIANRFIRRDERLVKESDRLR